MPVVVSNYRKQKVEKFLVKFYSSMNQALDYSKEEHGDIPFPSDWSSDGNTSSQAEIWYREYVTKYLKTVKEEKVNREYYRLIFMDGSGFTSWTTSGGTMYVFYCVDFSKCLHTNANYDGKNSFLFVYDKSYSRFEPIFRSYSHAAKLSSCANKASSGHACAALIQENGWKIPDDYPYKF